MPHTLHQLTSRLTFRQRQVFLMVHQYRSYSRAGEQLGLTQPGHQDDEAEEAQGCQAEMEQALFPFAHHVAHRQFRETGVLA